MQDSHQILLMIMRMKQAVVYLSYVFSVSGVWSIPKESILDSHDRIHIIIINIIIINCYFSLYLYNDRCTV